MYLHNKPPDIYHTENWQKKLYIKQSFPDNYVDASFLSAMRKNVNVRVYTFRELMLGAGHVHQHISSLIMFFVFFWLLYQRRMEVSILLLMNNALLGGIYSFWMYFKVLPMTKDEDKYARKQVAKAGIIFLMTLLALSPALKTLTEDISTDTITTLVALLTVVNLWTHCYGEERCKQPHPLALNAAIFAAVMLASRLDSRSEVFALMSLSVIWFALFPYARNYLAMKHFPQSHRLMTAFMMMVTSLSLMYVGGHFMWQYLALSVFILFLCPLWYQFLQRYKNTIHGPWDEAKLS